MCECIGMAEADYSTIGDVPEILRRVTEARICSLPDLHQQLMSPAFGRFTLTKFIDKPHFAANLLHPKYRGSSLSSDERLKAYAGLQDLCQTLLPDDSCYGQVNISLDQFIRKGNVFAKTGPP